MLILLILLFLCELPGSKRISANLIGLLNSDDTLPVVDIGGSSSQITIPEQEETHWDSCVEFSYVFHSFDAGSSGTRLQTINSDSIVDCEFKLNKGLSSLLYSTPEEVMKYFAPFKKCVDKASNQGTVKINMFGTAGLRLLTEEDRSTIWEKVINELSSWGYGDIVVKTISGEEEGVWSYIAANKLRGLLHSNNTLAVAEMGGVSAQITFVPKEHPLNGHFHFTTRLQGHEKEHNVFTQSLLGFGHDEAFQTILSKTDNPNEAPCIFKGYRIVQEDKTYVGTANIEGCLNLIMDVFQDNVVCKYESCSIYGKYIPKIPDNTNLLLISAFGYTADYVGCYGENKMVDCLYQNSANLEGKTLEEAKKQRGKLSVAKEEFMHMAIFNSVYDYFVLTKIYNIKPTKVVDFLTEINGITVSHLLGSKILDESNHNRRYCSH